MIRNRMVRRQFQTTMESPESSAQTLGNPVTIALEGDADVDAVGHEMVGSVSILGSIRQMLRITATTAQSLRDQLLE